MPLAAFAVVLALAVVRGPLAVSDASRLTSAAPGDGSPVVPVPPDAAPEPLGRPATPPEGSGGYKLLRMAGGRAVAFDPCRPVHWVLQPGGPSNAHELVAGAWAAVSTATGLRVVDDGATDESWSERRPLVQEDRYGRRYAPVLVAWSDERRTSKLAGTVAGFAGPLTVDPDGRGPRHVSGAVVLDVDAFAAADPTADRSIVLHELGHLVGLDHVGDPGDVMFERSPPVLGFTPGALRGLAVLGGGPCFG